MRTPSASSVSAPPASDDAARLPCLTTGRRWPHDDRRHGGQIDGADPVTAGTDHVDGVGPICSVGSRRACYSITSANSATSAAVGAFIFIATAKAAICAGVADPVMICAIAQPACPRCRSWFAVKTVRTRGHDSAASEGR